jgi:hypothetical protein
VREGCAFIGIAQVAVGIDVDNSQVRIAFVNSGDDGGGERMLTAESEGKLAALKDVSYGISSDLECGRVIKTSIIESGTGVDTDLNRAAVEFLIIQFHLA